MNLFTKAFDQSSLVLDKSYKDDGGYIVTKSPWGDLGKHYSKTDLANWLQEDEKVLVTECTRGLILAANFLVKL